MKGVPSMKSRISFILVLALCLTLLAGCGSKQKANFTIQIDSSQVAYIESNGHDLGSHVVRMEDSPKVITSFIDMLNGEYSYYDTWKKPRASGGGPLTVRFYDDADNEIMKVQFEYQYLYVYHKEKAAFYRFKNTDHPLDFTSFYKSVYGPGRTWYTEK